MSFRVISPGYLTALGTPLIRGRMRALTSGQVLEVLSEEPSAHEGIPAWSRMTGNELIHVEPGESSSRFYIRKK